MIADEKFTAKKNRRKAVRVFCQIAILLAIAAAAVTVLFTLKDYKPYEPQNPAGDKGFIALSYFGVERKGNQNLIGVENLQKHLQALKAQGYVTISQQDIVDYYQAGKNLPEKSLFLIFEDGRRDTAIFAQKILEDLNLQATMLTYPENFRKQDPKFLLPADLLALQKTSFWELGTNGYRLAFINVFDRYDHYLGELDPLEHTGVAPYLGRKYNHYLMDYIRDEYGVPKESHSRMRQRIAYDYETLRDVYRKSLNHVPRLYILMHSNTGSFGNNDKVSAENQYWIHQLFKMNFNREGFALNQRNSSIFDLTRMQPQAYWSANHLLMRIKYDINQELDFVNGDPEKQKDWQTLKGAAEFRDETIILTSLPKDKGLLRLKNSNDFADLKLSAQLKGNKLGVQKIYLRADENLTRFLTVAIIDNVLTVTEKTGAAEKQLLTLNLDQHDGKQPLSIPEDKKAAAMRELEILAKYADSVELAKLYAARLRSKSFEHAPTVAEGAAPYLPELSVHAKGDRLLSLSLKGNTLSVQIDGKDAATGLAVSALQAGSVYLETAWGGYGWSQRNLADDVYDGVFEKLLITENSGAEQEKILFDGRLQGFDAFKLKWKQRWETLIDWFITHL